MITEASRLTRILPERQAKSLARDRGLETVGDLLAFWPRRYRSRESDQISIVIHL